MKYELDVEKINKILVENDRTQSWLARQIDVSPALLSYVMTHKTLDHAAKIEQALGLGSKSLIKQPE